MSDAHAPSTPVAPSASAGAMTLGTAPDQAGQTGTSTLGSGFRVDLGDVFEGPFDLLLGLISKHKLDVTEVALSTVTDEFIAYIKARGPDWDLGQATEFLVVAATLLDLKAARLLPSGVVEDEEDLALLEARDLLFARLLQYRAYKLAAAAIADRIATEASRFPRVVTLEPQFAGLLPEVLLGLGPQEFAALAARVMTPKPVQVVGLDHLHVPRVSVREQAAVLVVALRHARTSTFRALTADCEGTIVVVARFLALLELYREGVVAFEQVSPLGELTVRWTGGDTGDIDLTDDYDGSRRETAAAAVSSSDEHDRARLARVIDLRESDEQKLEESDDGSQ